MINKIHTEEQTETTTAISREVVEFTVLQRNVKELDERPWTFVSGCKRKATKVGSTAIVSGTVF